MSTSFAWLCPFCNRHATITDSNTKASSLDFNIGNKHGLQTVEVYVIVCPNPDCREYTLAVILREYACDTSKSGWRDKGTSRTWKLIPQAEVKVFPPFIPAPILDDYKEACLIRDLSPKASATLSRRCLQGMIRDFWGIKERTLFNEIEAIRDKVDPVTWAAIDAVRKIGNIGAHMEEDINLIVDVEPREAGLLIGLIETLLNDWYIVREERQKRMQDIISAAEAKAAARSHQ